MIKILEVLKMSNKKPGAILTTDEHREILLKLEAEEIQRLYQEKFAEMMKIHSSNSTPNVQRKRSYMNSPTMSEPIMRQKTSPMQRSLTTPQVSQ